MPQYDKDTVANGRDVLVVCNAPFTPTRGYPIFDYLPRTGVPTYEYWDPNNERRKLMAANIRRCKYLDDDNFYLAYVPEEPRFGLCQQLECLDYTKGSFPIEGEGSCYGMKESTVQQWRELEGLMGDTVTALEKAVYSTRPLNFAVWWPYSTRYERKSPSWGKAQFMAWVSREMFVSVFAYIAFLIHRCQIRGVGFWSDTLFNANIQTHWINMLTIWPATSQFDRVTRRIGGFIHPFKVNGWAMQWLPELKQLYKASIPLWFAYGPITSPPTNDLQPFPPALLPSVEDIDYATRHPLVKAFAQSLLEATSLAPPITYPPPAHDATPPPAVPATHQLAHLTSAKLFVEYRAKANTERLAIETPQGRAQRLQRKADYDGPNGQQMPGRGSTARIFYWETTADPGVRVRTRVNKKCWEDIWENRRGQRVYDDFHNEWDISSELGDDNDRWETRDYEEDFDEDLEFSGFSTTTITVTASNQGSNPDPQNAIHAEPSAADPVIQEAASQQGATNSNAAHTSGVLSPNEDLPVVWTDSVQDIMMYRYGCSTLPQTFAQLTPSLSFGEALETLVLAEDTTPTLDPASENIIRVLASHPQRSLGDHPITSYIGYQRQVDIECLKYQCTADNTPPGHRSAYRIVPRARSWPYKDQILVVDDAITAVQVLRNGWGPSILEVVRELVRRGMPFHLYQIRPHVYHTQTHWKEDRWGYTPTLGRHFGCTGTAADFKAYVHARSLVLQNDRLSRAMLMQGGIAWRLVSDEFDFDNAAKLFSLDPYYGDGESRTVELTGIGEVWEEWFTAAECNVVSGVYMEKTGTSRPQIRNERY